MINKLTLSNNNPLTSEDSTLEEYVKNQLDIDFWPKTCQFCHSDGVLFASLSKENETYYFNARELKWIKADINALISLARGNGYEVTRKTAKLFLERFAKLNLN